MSYQNLGYSKAYGTTQNNLPVFDIDAIPPIEADRDGNGIVTISAPTALVTITTGPGFTGDGTSGNPLELNIVHDTTITGDGGVTPLSVNIQHDTTLTGNGTVATPLSVNVQHDGSLTGNGTVATPLSLNVQHDVTLTGNGDGTPLSINAQVNPADLQGNGTVATPLDLSAAWTSAAPATTVQPATRVSINTKGVVTNISSAATFIHLTNVYQVAPAAGPSAFTGGSNNVLSFDPPYTDPKRVFLNTGGQWTVDGGTGRLQNWSPAVEGWYFIRFSGAIKNPNAGPYLAQLFVNGTQVAYGGMFSQGGAGVVTGSFPGSADLASLPGDGSVNNPLYGFNCHALVHFFNLASVVTCVLTTPAGGPWECHDMTASTYLVATT